MSKHVFSGTPSNFLLARPEHVPGTVSSGKAMRKLAEFTQLFKRRLLHVLALGVPMAMYVAISFTDCLAISTRAITPVGLFCIKPIDAPLP